tara:strand:- start:12679 stop:13815 length:1137 start_codon:yes stop_codon:yes gene_type:complete
LSNFFNIIGQGLKLGPINYIDELFLFTIIIYLLLNKKLKLKINSFFIFGIYFFILNIVGFLIWNEISALRLSLLGILIILSSGIKIEYFSKTSILSYWLFPVFIIIINLYEIINFDKIIRYSHQDWLWSGTAYSSLGIIVSSVLISVYYKNNFKFFFLHFIICFLAGILTDSRTSILFLAIYFCVVLYDSYNSFKFNFKFKDYFYIIFLIIGFTSLLYYYSNEISFISAIFKLFVSNGNISSVDPGRANQISILFSIINDSNIINILFGYGGESFKHILVDYIGPDNNSFGRRIVRPIGFSAIFISGGVFYFLIIYLKKISLLFVSFKNSILTKNFSSLNKFYYLIFILILFPFITNVFDSLLYWFLIFKLNIDDFRL